MRASIATLLLIVAIPSLADTLVGRVVGVTDGDTIQVLDGGNHQFKIRLAGIDAPEKVQPFGQRSKQHLSSWVIERNVIVEWSKRDRYGRIVGTVRLNGVDVNLEQIKSGMAWWYKKYRQEQSDRDQYIYSSHEAEARQKRVGLWRDADPVPPWEWRKQSK